ncbi:MAG: hypothetical protein C5B51_23045 [Terriglobia bacterium]|nr:MAG: hypothetical protein C5B51_23045 [Terriglobia bacterium]
MHGGVLKPDIDDRKAIGNSCQFSAHLFNRQMPGRIFGKTQLNIGCERTRLLITGISDGPGALDNSVLKIIEVDSLGDKIANHRPDFLGGEHE